MCLKGHVCFCLLLPIQVVAVLQWLDLKSEVDSSPCYMCYGRISSVFMTIVAPQMALQGVSVYDKLLGKYWFITLICQRVSTKLKKNTYFIYCMISENRFVLFLGRKWHLFSPIIYIYFHFMPENVYRETDDKGQLTAMSHSHHCCLLQVVTGPNVYLEKFEWCGVSVGGGSGQDQDQDQLSIKPVATQAL